MEENEITKHLELREGFEDLLKDLEKIIIAPTVKISQKYSVPVIYVNNQTLASPWSKKVRSVGGTIFKFWDRPVKALVKICKYAEYRRAHS